MPARPSRLNATERRLNREAEHGQFSVHTAGSVAGVDGVAGLVDGHGGGGAGGGGGGGGFLFLFYFVNLFIYLYIYYYYLFIFI